MSWFPLDILMAAIINITKMKNTGNFRNDLNGRNYSKKYFDSLIKKRIYKPSGGFVQQATIG